ncbi:MAG: DUF6070 family protein [Oscillospiraceae bacterium]|jgi:hypothetical protein
MKRYSVFFLLLFLSLLCACGTEPSSEDQTDDTADTDGYYDTAFTLDDSYKAKLSDETVTAAETCAALYQGIDRGTTINTVLDADTIEAMVLSLGDAGYTAVDSNNTLNLTNPEPIQDFVAAVEDKKDAEASYYIVYEDGSICRFLLCSSADGHSVITVPINWTADGTPKAQGIAKYSILDISYTKKGYLIYERDISNYKINKKFTLNPYTLLRVAPLDETCRTLCATYIRPIGYLKNNLFLTSWDQNSLDTINFNYLYPMLYGLYYHCDPLHSFTADEAYTPVPGTNLFAVPSATFEAMVGQYFDRTPDQLRTTAVYDAEGDFYPISIFVSNQKLSTALIPEVTEYWYNEDGTLTMQVEAVFPKEGTDCAFRHDVTVSVAEDGRFHYLSNRFYDAEKNILPSAKMQIDDEISRYYG